MSKAAVLGSFTWKVVSSLAAPTPDTTAITNPIAELGWKKEPRGRGTLSIILTSVLTLSLCVWTAIHPNVIADASAWHKLKHRLLFVLLGMMAPESVLAMALYQWREAQKFHREWCELYGISPGSEQDTLRMNGAFFVTMGGVSIAPAYKVPNGVPNILSTDAYLQLARTHVGWRTAQKVEFTKPLTQAATLTAACEAAKTRDADDEVRAPSNPDLSGPQQEQGYSIALVGSEYERLVAVEKKGQEEEEMIIKREFVHYRDVQDKCKAEVLGKALVCVQALWMLVQCVVRKASGLPVTLLEIHVATHVVYAIVMYAFWFNKPLDVGEPLPIRKDIDLEQIYVELVGNDYKYKEHKARVVLNTCKQDSGSSSLAFTPVSPLPTNESVRFPGIFRHRFASAIFRVRREPGPPDIEFFKQGAKAYEAGKEPTFPHVYLLRSIPVININKIVDQIDVSNLAVIFILPVYGACHAAAWNTHFPTSVECMLWRISSVSIAIIPAYLFLLRVLYKNGNRILSNVLTFGYIEVYHFWRRLPIYKVFRPITDLFEKSMAMAVIGLILAARLYLLIEPFLSLRSLPYGSFESTPWEDYFPHF